MEDNVFVTYDEVDGRESLLLIEKEDLKQAGAVEIQHSDNKS